MNATSFKLYDNDRHTTIPVPLRDAKHPCMPASPTIGPNDETMPPKSPHFFRKAGRVSKFKRTTTGKTIQFTKYARNSNTHIEESEKFSNKY